MSQQFPNMTMKFPNARLTWNFAVAAFLSSILELVLNIAGQEALSGIAQILGIISLICTFIFHFRSAMVARILQPAAPFSEPVWLIASLIMPIANLILPWILLRRIWRTTASAAGYAPNAGIMALHLWWASFVFAAALMVQHIIADVLPVMEQAQSGATDLVVPERPLYTHFAYMGQLLIFIWMANRLTRLQADVGPANER